MTPGNGTHAAGAPPSPLREIVLEVAHYLPEQAPLHAFVHHNTLHAFEHLPFERAVVEGARVFGTEPFQLESAFAKCLASGRILPADLDAVVRDAINGDDPSLFPGGPTRSEFRKERLRHLFEVPKGAALRWLVEETDATTRCPPDLDPVRRAEIAREVRIAPNRKAAQPSTSEAPLLSALWRALLTAAPDAPPPAKLGPRVRDRVLAHVGIDTDEVVHPLLIRTCAAFLDQGVAYWRMPDRERGYLAAFRALYGRGAAPPDAAFRGLGAELRRQESLGWNAEETVLWALGRLQIAEPSFPLFIRETLLSLRGWAGMMWGLERFPEKAPVAAPPASLLDYLAVELVLDLVATKNALGWELDGTQPLAELLPPLTDSNDPPPRTSKNEALAYEAFVLALRLPVGLSTLCEPANTRAWLAEVEVFDDIERRTLLHLAYERRHRIEVLDGLAAEGGPKHTEPPTPDFQAVFCIDDREESLRRHLEESYPACTTYGYAGFFGAAMNYQGLDDVRPRPLCPVVVTPKHLVTEEPVDAADGKAYRTAKRAQAVFGHSYSVASRTLLRGGLVAHLFGLLILVPLVLRSLFPRLAERWSHALNHRLAQPPVTRLKLEREGEETRDGLLVGYSVLEMTNIVRAALRTMGISAVSPVVLIVGHGSSSLNNPHEAAHDCGATGGGRGGPNARAFAAMANHVRVREALTAEGLIIPDSTWFLGSYHNTCDDVMTYYDEDLVPERAREAVAKVQQALFDACRLDAHERCRRFESAPRGFPLSRALALAEVHANNLAEPRPEYGHCTNAVCVVGRREKTRGLFLDRRAFLVSYDATKDPDGKLLTPLLLAVGPVGAGINLEYYFSFVDPVGYGCGTKLPHNITGLLGVMDGHASDLRTGLPWQMVEIHEPVRLLTVIEAEPEILTRIVEAQPSLAGLILNRWIQVIAWSPSTGQLFEFRNGGFQRYVPESTTVPVVVRSTEYYSGKRQHLAPARATAAFEGSLA